MVTHGIHWLPNVDSIVVMVDGSISEAGSYEELLSHDRDFAEFLRTYLQQQDDDDEEDEDFAQFLITYLQQQHNEHHEDEECLYFYLIIK